MLLALYYGVSLFVGALCWPYSYGTRDRTRVLWVALALVVVSLPFLVPLKVAFYYALAGNVSVFFWSADSYMGKLHSRSRGLIGGVVVAMLPLVWRGLLNDWYAVSLIPTLGHLVVSGVIWAFVRRF